jgi:SulP family sulfate permease
MLFALINKYTPHNSKNDILSGLTVALALVPEAVAFALLAGVGPLVGLYAAFIIGLVTSIIGGRPGMISGATGAVAVVIGTLVAQHGVEYLFAAVVLTGLIQIIFGLLKMGKFIRLVPHPVFLGFVNGLALVIFLAQIQQFKVDGQWLNNDALLIMFGIIAITMLIIQYLPKLTKAIPSTLVAIVVGSVGVILLGIDTRTVGDIASIKGSLPPFHLPEIALSFETLQIVFPYAIVMALVGLIESLLTLNLVDELTETTGSPNKECVGQGVANTITGFFGGMGGCAMVGQSLINIKSGGRGRLSGIVASLTLLAFILFLSDYIEKIPVAVLIGVMFMVVIGTFEWCSLKLFGKIPFADWLTIFAVTLITVFTDNLALAVIIGVLMSAISFSWLHAKHISVKSNFNEISEIQTYEVEGLLFFASTQNFQNLFNPKNDPENVFVDFKNSKVMDHSAIQAIDKLAERYQKVGKQLHLKHLSAECRDLLKSAKKLVEVNVLEDPTYHVADNKLG